MPRLLIPIVSTQRGGAEDYAKAIAAQAAAEYDVHAFVSDLDAMNGLAAELREIACTINRHTDEKSATRTVGAINPDVVLLPLPGLRYGHALLREIGALKIPCCVVYQLIRWEQWSSPIERDLKLLLSNSLIHTVVVSQSDYDQLTAKIPNARVSLIHNGIDLDRFRSRSGTAEARSKLGLTDDAIVCLSIGRLDRQKGCDILLSSLPKLKLTHPNLVVLWAGVGPMHEKLMADAHTMGLTESLRFLGRRDDIPDLLAASDVFVFPSRFEGFSFALLEAMAAEVPIVASDIPAVREAVGDETCATLVPADDVYHLRRGIAASLGDRERAKLRAKAAADRVTQFSQDAMCKSTMELLRTSAKQHSHV